VAGYSHNVAQVGHDGDVVVGDSTEIVQVGVVVTVEEASYRYPQPSPMTQYPTSFIINIEEGDL
jgi:hypothetical protein